MVAETDIRMAYRLLLGREAEDDLVVASMAKAHPTLQDVRREFLSSPEFRERIRDMVAGVDTEHKPLNWKHTRVDVDVDATIVDRMMARIEGEFLDLGETEPHWSVLTEDRFKADRIDETENDFYESGQGVVNDLRLAAERCEIDLAPYQTCFELGCGLGRITAWLARLFPKVLAADISALHLSMAQKTMSQFGLDNISFLHLNRFRAYDSLPNFDVFFSIIVLQHNPPPLMKILLARILDKLNPGGLAYFQIPTYALRYEFSATGYLETVAPPKRVEVHYLPQPELFRIIRSAGCEVLECREDGAVGAAAISNRLLIRKG